MADVTLPQLGETVTEGTITQWFKQVGDNVAADEPLFEVSTDKVDTEVPSPVAGTLTEIRVQEGETVEVGTVIAVVGDGDGAPAAAPAPAAEAATGRGGASRGGAGARSQSRSRRPRTAEPAPRPRHRRSRSPSRQPPPNPNPPPRRPPTRRVCCCRRWSAGSSTSTASTRRRSTAPVPADGSPATTCSTTSTSPAPSPPKRHLRRRRRPSRQRRPSRRHRPRPTPGRRRSRQPRPAPSVAAGQRDTTVKLSKIRKLTGQHMIMSKSVSPHAFSVVEVDFANVDTTRSAIKGEWKSSEGFSLTYLPFIGRATIDALAEFPHLNASVGENELVVHNFVDLGIAVDLDYEGLIVPVIREADTQAAAGDRPGDPRPRQPGAHEEARSRRDQRRHVHHLQQRLRRVGADDAGDQPAAGGDPVDRRHRPQARRRWRPRTAARRSPSTPSATWRWHGTTARSTAPTPPASSSGSRTSSRPRTGHAEL